MRWKRTASKTKTRVVRSNCAMAPSLTPKISRLDKAREPATFEPIPAPGLRAGEALCLASSANSPPRALWEGISDARRYAQSEMEHERGRGSLWRQRALNPDRKSRPAVVSIAPERVPITPHRGGCTAITPARSELVMRSSFALLADTSDEERSGWTT